MVVSSQVAFSTTRCKLWKTWKFTKRIFCPLLSARLDSVAENHMNPMIKFERKELKKRHPKKRIVKMKVKNYLSSWIGQDTLNQLKLYR